MLLPAILPKNLDRKGCQRMSANIDLAQVNENKSDIALSRMWMEHGSAGTLSAKIKAQVID